VAKQHRSSATEFLVLGGVAAGAYLLWKQHEAAAPPADGTITPTPTPAAFVPLSPPVDLGTTYTPQPTPTPAGSGGVTTTIPGVPLNSGDVYVGTAGGQQIVEQQVYHTAYGDVLPSNFVTQNDPRTGLQPVVDLVPTSTNPQTITVPTPTPSPSQTTTGTTGIQGPVDICAQGVQFPNNNPTDARGNKGYASLHDGLVAAFQELGAIYDAYGNAGLTIDGIANYWVNVYGDGLPWGSSNPASTQLTFSATMTRLTGLHALQGDGIYQSFPKDIGNMVRLLRGIIGTVQGAQYMSAVNDACMLAAYNDAFGTNYTSVNG
jgi:hypothetical protein